MCKSALFPTKLRVFMPGQNKTIPSRLLYCIGRWEGTTSNLRPTSFAKKTATYVCFNSVSLVIFCDKTQDAIIMSPALTTTSQDDTKTVLRTLKKRPVRSTRDMVNLSSYDSGFLTGLFKDVAQASVLTQFEIGEKREAACIEASSDESLSSVPTKKQRLSLNRCLSRARASQLNLSELTESLPSPRAIHDFPANTTSTSTRGTPTPAMTTQDSLAYQLDCVSNESSNSVGDAGRFAFPNLPTSISDSSCSTGLTRARLVRQPSSPENNDIKESFGWFVDLDDNSHQTSMPPPQRAGISAIVSSENLAFQAQTAPKGEHDEAELEWAKAADTVDDVLGDFFWRLISTYNTWAPLSPLLLHHLQLPTLLIPSPRYKNNIFPYLSLILHRDHVLISCTERYVRMPLNMVLSFQRHIFTNTSFLMALRRI